MFAVIQGCLSRSIEVVRGLQLPIGLVIEFFIPGSPGHTKHYIIYVLQVSARDVEWPALVVDI